MYISGSYDTRYSLLIAQVSGSSTPIQFDEPLFCADRICEQCGGDHDFEPTFDDVKTSIDIIPGLLNYKRSTSFD